jgi:hypothetical protein
LLTIVLGLRAFLQRWIAFEIVLLLPKAKYQSHSTVVWEGVVTFSRHWHWVLILCLWEECQYGDLLWVATKETRDEGNWWFGQYKGQQGVELAVKILMAELRMTMALAGWVYVWILGSGSC